MEYRMLEDMLMIEPGEEIDHHQAERIIRYTENLIRQRRVNRLIFDLSDTLFMDSAGVGMMIGLYREMQLSGGWVGIIHMGDGIRRIYRMAGLQRIIRCYDNEEALMTAMKEGEGSDEG